MKTIEQLTEYFKNDIFATDAGCVIEEAGENYALCAMPIDARHRNARGAVMGGAIFTLADFAFAVSANANGVPTVSLSANIIYMRQPKGKKLIARSSIKHNGKTTCAATVVVCDELGTNVAEISVSGIHLA